MYKRQCRHAASEAYSAQVRDHDRSISEAGRAASEAVARHLRDVAWLPDLLLCSNSRRTRQTVDAMAAEVPAFGDADAHFLGTLYTVAALDGMTQSHLAMRVRPHTESHLAMRVRPLCRKPPRDFCTESAQALLRHLGVCHMRRSRALLGRLDVCHMRGSRALAVRQLQQE